MSKDAVGQLMQAAGSDVALQERLETAGGFASVVQIGAEKGYHFTEEDARVFLSERGIVFGENADGELSEEALEAVAGGWFENLSIRFGNNPTINIRHW